MQDPPSREGLDQIATEREKLYRCRPTEVLQVPILVTPVTVDDVIPSEADIEQAVRELKRRRAGGLSGMRAKDLKG